MKQTLQAPIKNKWHYVLHKLFDYPSIVLIGGKWKTGKTDFALYIAEMLMKLSSSHGEGTTMINEVASNIETKNSEIKQIYDLISLRQWLYGTNKRKLYILDEASEHLPSRRAMSSKTVGFIQIIPEISKAHARMLVVGHQLLTVDKTLLDDVWCRGAFIKLNLKTAQLFSSLLQQPFTFRGIPRTSIKFDPYVIAPFQETPVLGQHFKDEDKEEIWKWVNGATYESLGIKNPQELSRKIRRMLKSYMEKDLYIVHT